jgi:hypothetical protein
MRNILHVEFFNQKLQKGGYAMNTRTALIIVVVLALSIGTFFDIEGEKAYYDQWHESLTAKDYQHIEKMRKELTSLQGREILEFRNEEIGNDKFHLVVLSEERIILMSPPTFVKRIIDPFNDRHCYNLVRIYSNNKQGYHRGLKKWVRQNLEIK